MTNTIFRAKRSYDKKWMYGNLVIDREGEKHIVPFEWIEKFGHHLRIDSDEPLFFDQETFGQFTGLTDKNGTKIFDGDILYFKPYNTPINNREVIFADGCFLAKLIRNGYCDVIKCLSEYKVIGNIHDNPELLL